MSGSVRLICESQFESSVSYWAPSRKQTVFIWNFTLFLPRRLNFAYDKGQQRQDFARKRRLQCLGHQREHHRMLVQQWKPQQPAKPTTAPKMKRSVNYFHVYLIILADQYDLPRTSLLHAPVQLEDQCVSMRSSPFKGLPFFIIPVFWTRQSSFYDK